MKNAAFFLYQKDKILILRKSSGKYKGQWSTPGGGMEFFETPKQAAVRELKEETGIIYHTLDKKLKVTLKQGDTIIFVVEVKKIPDIHLSEEHDAGAIVKFKDLKKYKLTYYFQDTLDYLRENNLL